MKKYLVIPVSTIYYEAFGLTCSVCGKEFLFMPDILERDEEAGDMVRFQDNLPVEDEEIPYICRWCAKNDIKVEKFEDEDYEYEFEVVEQ